VNTLKTIVALSCLVFFLAPVFPGTLSREASVILKSGKISYTITYNRGKSEWADYVETMANRFLKAAENFLSIPFPRGSGFIIQGREEVIFSMKGSPLDGVRIGGYNLWDEVALEYGISPVGNPALLFHELGHFWFPDGEQKWLLEGIVSYLPLAMADAGTLALENKEYTEIQTHWGLRYTSYGKDFPLEKDFRGKDNDNRSFFYMKTFKLQYLLDREMKRDTYREFLPLYQGIMKDCSTKDLLGLLQRHKKRDWKSFLSGWVFPGPYQHYAYTDFSDPDCDTLLSIDEVYLKTDPGKGDTDNDRIPDGTELLLGLDPRVPEGKKEQVRLIEEHGPFIDGEKSDWQVLPGVTAREQGGDGTEKVYDLISLMFGLRGEFLVIFAETTKPPVRKEFMMFDLLVDYDMDNKTDREFAFRLDNPHYNWMYLSKTGNHRQVDGLTSGLNSGCEMRIPVGAIGSDKFRILPIIRDWKKEVNSDEWDNWVLVNTRVLEKVESYGLQTDLIKADADKDGIPDGAEITLGLNPVKKDPRSALKTHGPFIDGVNSEWEVLKSHGELDKKSDTKKMEYDLISMNYLIKDSFLYILIRTAKKPGQGEHIMFDILVDADMDYHSDYDFAFFLSRPGAPWNYVVSRGTSIFPPGLQSAMDEVIEMAIPLSAIKSREFRVLPIMRDDKKKVNYDEWGSWVTINVQ
jgi:hypothetical protein